MRFTGSTVPKVEDGPGAPHLAGLGTQVTDDPNSGRALETDQLSSLNDPALIAAQPQTNAGGSPLCVRWPRALQTVVRRCAWRYRHGESGVRLRTTATIGLRGDLTQPEIAALHASRQKRISTHFPVFRSA
jgi:hypothetical protein